MTASEFIVKWGKVDLKERSAAQEHFIDLCHLVGHPTPAEADPHGESFCFEKGAAKQGGGEGFADAWKKDFFGWEYKGKHKDLEAAYDQLLRYKDALSNPPLLVVCDLARIVIRTNFTRTVPAIHDLALEQLDTPRSLEILHAVFFDPERLKPGQTSQAITQNAAEHFAEIAESMRQRGLAPATVARFLDRIVFCLFAEDIGLLPEAVFTHLVEKSTGDLAKFGRMLGQLFQAMAKGGEFGVETIRHFDGNPFDEAPVPALTATEVARIAAATSLDWSAVDPSIFGTLFERGLDPAKRSQLGAHFTGRDDIETIVEQVVMAPLRQEWEKTRQAVGNLLTTGRRRAVAPTSSRRTVPARRAKAVGEAGLVIHRFLVRLQTVRVLDPACGSGNFLYVVLLKLKNLEKEAITHAIEQGLDGFLPMVGPWQLHGIEISPYAFDLAQMSVWIGWLQWIRTNGFGSPDDPILRPMTGNFRRMDAILDLSDPANPREPEWPKADFIVGNPPFLGTKKLRSELGDAYVEALFRLYGHRIPNFSDLCCYWFEKARAQVEKGRCQRAGLLATQGIRGGLNREVLKRIKTTGDIFWAESDREWVLDGANVHVSMVGFDDGRDTDRRLDGRPVPTINANLTASADTTTARRLPENAGLGFIADVKAGRFDIPEQEAIGILWTPNPHGAPSSDVILPWINSLDVLRRDRHVWIIDFGVDTPRGQAALYQEPYRIVEERVLPERAKVERERYGALWWLHARPCPEMRRGITPLPRFLATPTVAKHRIFAWSSRPTLPDHQLVVFARADDYFLGVLHSRVHEVWALAQGTQLREKESGFRYTPTTCFETFPFPWPPGQEPAGDSRVHAIADSARVLCELRDRWLNPPEWIMVEELEFPATVGGPWDRYIVNPRTPAPAAGTGVQTVREPDTTALEFALAERAVAAARAQALAARPVCPGDIGLARYPRLVARDAQCAAGLVKRTLTALYNERPTWLADAHRRLDEAVFCAYGWEGDLSQEAILERLIELNLARA